MYISGVYHIGWQLKSLKKLDFGVCRPHLFGIYFNLNDKKSLKQRKKKRTII